MEIIRVVEQSPLPVGRVLEQLNVPRSSFFESYRQYLKEGEDGLSPRQRERRQFWNRIPEQVQGQIMELALEHPDKSSREIAWLFTDREQYFVSESSVYRLLKRFDRRMPEHPRSRRRRSRWSRPPTRSARPRNG